MSFYLATFWAGLRSGFPYFQWIAFASACVATVAAIQLWHHGSWDLGLRARPVVAIREWAAGALFGAVLIGLADLVIEVFTPLRHARGHGFPVAETALVFVPAVLHEELVFRGYPYQLLRRIGPWFAIVASSLVFAALHARNEDVTTLALINVFLGGVVLALAYERYRRLWMPIGLHFAWNIMSGPILGYDVSGFTSSRSVLVTVVKGPGILTGAGFGIEGSILMTLVEVAAAAALLRREP